MLLRIALALAFAVTPIAAGAAQGTSDACKDLGYKIGSPSAGAALTSSRSFTIDSDNAAGGYSVLALWVQFVDGDASITRFDITCTVSDDANVTDYTPQVCDDTSDGICTLTNAGVWRKGDGATGAGTMNFPLTIGIAAKPDQECTFSVGAGSAASIDTLRVKARVCTK